MKIVIAIDSLKGSLSSIDGSAAIAEGIREVYPEAIISALPLADGGEGTAEALVTATNGFFESAVVTGPLGQSTDAQYGILGDGVTAAIEVAAACGLPLISADERNPLLATTYGVGELILEAIRHGCRKFIIGLGGSATNDGGVGMLQALGFRFLDEHGQDVGRGGQALTRLHQIESDGAEPLLRECSFQVACDVDNPLYGPEGAAYIFAPQKGATAEMVQQLDEGLQQFAAVAQQSSGIELSNIPGAGAAGGLGAAFAGFLHAELQSGVELVLGALNMEQHLIGAQLLITGEGRLDGQTSRGKAPLGAAKLAAKHAIPVIALAGSVGPEAKALNEAGISAYFPILSGPMTLEQAMNPAIAAQHMKSTTEQLLRLLKAAGWSANLAKL
ncbi:glycerate kinase [Paenibacillaceae bacterium]|nr:glycerate kinase [Paenibacillaceae bacterium]